MSFELTVNSTKESNLNFITVLNMGSHHHPTIKDTLDVIIHWWFTKNSKLNNDSMPQF